MFCIAFAIACDHVCIKDTFRIPIPPAAESQKAILCIVKKVVINPHANGVVYGLPMFWSYIAIAGASLGVVELEISSANEGTMVNSSKPGCFVIGSEGSADKDGSNTCLLATGVKNTLCEAIVIPSDRNRRGKLASAYSGI